MARFVNFAFVEDSSDSFSVISVSPNLRPGLSARRTFVVRVANVPDGIPDDDVKALLIQMVNPYDPPALVDWSELARADR